MRGLWAPIGNSVRVARRYVRRYRPCSSARSSLLGVVVEEGLGPGDCEESLRGDSRIAKFERAAVECQGTPCLHEDAKGRRVHELDA